MVMDRFLRLALLSVYFVLLFHHTVGLSGSILMPHSGSQLALSDNPSTAVIKVGNQAAINLTVVGEAASGQVCFGQQGFPNSGFTLTFLPQCAMMQQSVARAQLIVEATPAAAPQNFTALILASLGNETVSAPLTITVVPAIPAWIPWLGIVLFFLVIGTALFIRPRKSKSKSKGKING
jgi:hypothetical protein